MTGAGFGGCAVAWVAAADVARFAEGVAAAYREATGIAPGVRVCRASPGAELFTP